MVDIPCPEMWGYACTPDNITTCEKGYYCETPGEKVICPKGFICELGSTHPRRCVWWEFCLQEGMKRAHPIASLMYAGFMVSCVSVGLAIAVFMNRQYEKYSRRLLDKSANLRFNAFNENASLSDKSQSSSSKGSHLEMVEVDGEELPAASPKLADNVSSSIKFEFRNPFAFNRSRDNDSQRFLGRNSNDSFMGMDTLPSRQRRQSTIVNQDEATHRIDIEFINMSVVLRDGRKILDNISGTLESGTMTVRINAMVSSPTVLPLTLSPTHSLLTGDHGTIGMREVYYHICSNKPYQERREGDWGDFDQPEKDASHDHPAPSWVCSPGRHHAQGPDRPRDSEVPSQAQGQPEFDETSKTRVC